MTVLNRSRLAGVAADLTPAKTPPRSRRPKTRPFDRLLWIALAIAYLGAGFAALWRSDQVVTTVGSAAASWVAFMIRTFWVHLGLATTVGIAIAALRRRSVLALAGIPLFIWCLGPMIQNAWATPAHPTTPPDLIVMSANLLRTNDLNADHFLEQVHQARPDVLVLQEYAFAWHDRIGPRLEAMYPHREMDLRVDAYGCAVFSKWPFVETPQIRLPLGNQHVGHMRLVLEKDDRPFALYNTHLANPASFVSLGEQRAQLASLRVMLERETLPVIVCGDFNESLRSGGLQFFADFGFNGGDRLTGGNGPTWRAGMPLQPILGVRIDHVFSSSPLVCLRQRLGQPFGSDHLPIIADFAMPTRQDASLSQNAHE